MNQPWTSPETTGVGRLPMHSLTHTPDLLLDGTWRFQLLRGPEQAPDAGGWRDVVVPSCWTREGSWDSPHYTNVQMPFPGQPPEIPRLNPTGVYDRSFHLPETLRGRRIVLHIGAAESVVLVQLNQQDVGVSKDSHLAAEFDVTDLVRPGPNDVRLTVVKWSDATYVEDQDQWWHGGITRSVFLYQTGPAYLADIGAIAGLETDLVTGSLALAVDIGFEGAEPGPGWVVEASIPGLLPASALRASDRRRPPGRSRPSPGDGSSGALPQSPTTSTRGARPTAARSRRPSVASPSISASPASHRGARSRRPVTRWRSASTRRPARWWSGRSSRWDFAVSRSGVSISS